MNKNAIEFDDLEVGYDIPAKPGMAETDIQTPCLILDLDALEHNIRKMGEFVRRHGMRHRAHGKMHKSPDVLKLQQELGDAVGVCCQKVSEAEVFVRAGIEDVFVSNEVRDPTKIDRLARLPKFGSRVSVCIDDIANVSELSDAVRRHGSHLDCLVEIDCKSGRCGVETSDAVVEIAAAIEAAPGLRFAGLHAYHGTAQHLERFEAREATLGKAIDQVREAMEALAAAGLDCDLVTGGGTGSYRIETESGIYNELQCGSYAFMDADYGRILGRDGNRIDRSEWKNALFVLTTVMSHVKPDRAVCDAGLKAQSVDSGQPVIFGREDVTFLKCSDEHGVICDPGGSLKVNEKLRLIPGHCDPTCNIHDWYVGVRGGVVETLWPISARGKSF